MSQQNFISQINMFMEFGKRNRLTSYERMFWIGLFHFANDMAQRNPNKDWPDDFFPVQNSDMTAWTGLEERNIRTIRNRFKQMGLIDYRKGDGKKSDPEYRIFYLKYIGYKIVADTVPDTNTCIATDNKNAPGSVGGTVPGSVSGSVPDTVGDTVPDNTATGNRNAPGSVTDATSKPLQDNSCSQPINIKYKDKEKKKENTEAEAGSYSYRGANGSNPAAYPPDFLQGCAGLVNLDEECGYSGGGLVPLPWDERVVV